MRSAVTYAPTRSIQGAYQTFVVYGGSAGDEVVWAYQSCDAVEQTMDSQLQVATTTRTSAALLTGNHSTYTVTKLLYKGAFKACLRVVGGVWTTITALPLTIVETPTYYPRVGLAGQVTPISIASAGLAANDFVVMSPGGQDCTGAGAITTTTATAMQRTPVYTDAAGHSGNGIYFSTESGMTTGDAEPNAHVLYVCVAAGESLGDSDDDYVVALTLTLTLTLIR